jgi:hypothetical protein
MTCEEDLHVVDDEEPSFLPSFLRHSNHLLPTRNAPINNPNGGTTQHAQAVGHLLAFVLQSTTCAATATRNSSSLPVLRRMDVA